MQGWGKGTEAGAVVRGMIFSIVTLVLLLTLPIDYPWQDLPENASVCDVGGGIGHISMQLHKAHPNLQIVLQDLPQTIQQAESDVWPKLCPEAIEKQKVQFKSFDFLAESPVSGCDIYYVSGL